MKRKTVIPPVGKLGRVARIVKRAGLKTKNTLLKQVLTQQIANVKENMQRAYQEGYNRGFEQAKAELTSVYTQAVEEENHD